MKRSMPLLVGLLAILLSAAGIVHSLRAACSYAIYHGVKYGPGRDAASAAAVSTQCERAYRLYSRNVYCTVLAAEKAWYAQDALPPEDRPGVVQIAERWCERGLALNPKQRDLRVIHARLLARTSIDDAVRSWNAYVDWHFWDAYNHAVCVELYAQKGDIRRAVESLRWVEGSPHYGWACRALEQALVRRTPVP